MAKPLLEIEMKYLGKKVQGDASDMVRDMERLPEVVNDAISKYLHWGAALLQREVTDRVSFPGTGHPGIKAPHGYLKSPGGDLKKSISSKVFASQGFAVVGTNVKYAAVHEYGATIRPKQAKYLTIPIPGALGKKAQNMGRIGDYEDIVFVRSDKGAKGTASLTAGLVQGSKYVPLFALVKQVEIPAREPFKESMKTKEGELTEGFDKQLGDKLNEEYGR